MNLVNELQESAEKDDVLTVLRKTKRVASKLDRHDIADWLQSEQAGYPAAERVPEYRKIGTSLAYNTNGYVPAGYGMVKNGVENIPSFNLTFPVPITNPISTVLSWIGALDAGNEIYHSIEGTEYGRCVRSHLHIDPMFAHQVTFMLHLSGLQIRAIPEQIKDKVLDWACALESAGVTGDGLSFSPKEMEIAHSITFNISNSHIEQLNNAGKNQRGGK